MITPLTLLEFLNMIMCETEMDITQEHQAPGLSSHQQVGYVYAKTLMSAPKGKTRPALNPAHQ